MAITVEQTLAILKSHANDQIVQVQARFGSRPGQALGIKIPVLRKLAKGIGKNQPLALELWDSGIHEARILASMIADPDLITPELMEAWVNNFDTWDICDQVCGNLFDKTSFAYQKAVEWCHREPEFVRRAGFTMMAELAAHDKKAPDEMFLQFFPLIQQYATDQRNFVKKAVNWALRGIGKRNNTLRPVAIEWANTIKQMDSTTARWIASDALRELQKRGQ